MIVQDYTPTEKDLAYFRNLIATTRPGGIWGSPGFGTVYRIGHATKTFHLAPPDSWRHTPMTMLAHHHNAAILAALGWKIEPEIDWKKDPPEVVQQKGAADGPDKPDATS
jgi:hypothetical protein